MVQEVEALLGREAVAELDFEALEVALRQRTLGLAARAIEQRLNADLSDETGSQVDCRCGKPARYAGRRDKQVQSVLGRLRLERAYYHCPACGHGFCPRDRYLGYRRYRALSRAHAHDGHGGGDGELSGRQPTVE